MKLHTKPTKATALAVACSALLCLLGCDARQATANVRRDFPNCEVAAVPGKTRVFIVRNTSNEVWFVENAGATTDEKSRSCLLLPARGR